VKRKGCVAYNRLWNQSAWDAGGINPPWMPAESIPSRSQACLQIQGIHGKQEQELAGNRKD